MGRPKNWPNSGGWAFGGIDVHLSNPIITLDNAAAAKGVFFQTAQSNRFLLPAIQVAMFVAAGAGQILADLGVAVGHEDTSDPRGSRSVKTVRFLLVPAILGPIDPDQEDPVLNRVNG